MNAFLYNVVARLPRPVQPYVKALVPLVAGVAVAGQDLVFDVAEVSELKVLIGSAVVALLTLALPNVDD